MMGRKIWRKVGATTSERLSAICWHVVGVVGRSTRWSVLAVCLLAGCTVGGRQKWRDTLQTLHEIAVSTRVSLDQMCDAVSPERVASCHAAQVVALKSLVTAQETIATTLDGLGAIESSSGLSGGLSAATKAIAAAQTIVSTWTH